MSFMTPMGMFFGGAAAPAPTVKATWDPLDKEANFVLSNGNLTASRGSSGYGGMRATLSATKRSYFEIVPTSTAANLCVGVANKSANLVANFGSDSNSYIVQPNGYPWIGSSPVGPGFADGSIVMVAFDPASLMIWFGTNGVFTGNPAAGSGGSVLTAGVYYPAINTRGATTMVATANFGATAFTYTPPTGFSAWG